jgi:non-heme chloroperoxidase
MAIFTTKDGTSIYYNDWGASQPILFSLEWPLSNDRGTEQSLLEDGGER